MRRLLADPSVNAKAWYVWCFASYVSVGPFLNIYFAERGLSKAQVGLIGALLPWASAPASFAWAALADRLGAHRAVLLGCFVAAVSVRNLLPLLPASFAGLLCVALAAEVLSSPVSVLADAAVMQLCDKESDYGKYRLWGAVGWGSFSTVAGWVITRFGTRWAFYLNALLSLPALVHGARLHAAKQPHHHHRHQRWPQGQGQAGGHSRARGHGESPLAGAAGGSVLDVHNGLQPSAGCKDRQSSGGDVADGRGDDDELRPLTAAHAEAMTGCEVSHRVGAGLEQGAAGQMTVDEERPAQGHGMPQHGAPSASGASVGACAAREDFWRILWALMRRSEVLLFFATSLAMGYGFGTIDSFL
ncbi:hypothetical protein GPECTOR_1g752 [Gonium pectorale]|uniref:Major facilitator superfamily associated domain-containing protein n=1 Tax=Gonium pectorale TaxID=33097 RepID=A0A150H450_GONPE|nr:hypothetical protein GPECTOR_1g752 [Gonium pectorale]|eukprot:KXZ56834.1 hypothetical protein GPECTOR_1g752 [Gonium pectorale]